MLILSGKVFSCEMSKSDILNIALSPEDNSFFSYVADQTLHKMPYIRAFNCTEAAMTGKYLMVALGPEIVELEDTSRGINFNGEYKESRCQIMNSPFEKAQNFEERLKDFQAKKHFLKSCLEVWVEDEGPQPMQTPKEQVGCDLQLFGKQKAMFSGGFCYFKPHFGSSYMVKFNIKPECLTRDGLAALDIKAKDFNAAINFYIAGDATGTSVNLRALSNTRMRFSINPDKAKVKASDDFGILYPTFPADWKIPDIHLGELKITEIYDGRAKIEHALLVDNRCDSGHCDYAQPVVADISLYKPLKNGKRELITTWYEGGIADSHFQGFIRGISFELGSEVLKEGGVFELEAQFTDPKFDFERFKRRLQNKLNTIDQQLGRLERSNIPNVQEIPNINTNRDFPTLSPIPNIIFDNPLNSVEQAVSMLRSYFSLKLWPPYYEGACGATSCESMKDSFLTLKTTFKVGKINPDDQTYDIKIDKVERISSLVKGYTKYNYQQPHIDCNYR